MPSGPSPLSLGPGKGGVVNGAAVADGGRDIFTQKKKSQGKNSPAESLMALGVIADARGRGILEFSQVAERERGPTDCRDLEPAQEVACCGGLWDWSGASRRGAPHRALLPLANDFSARRVIDGA